MITGNASHPFFFYFYPQVSFRNIFQNRPIQTAPKNIRLVMTLADFRSSKIEKIKQLHTAYKLIAEGNTDSVYKAENFGNAFFSDDNLSFLVRPTAEQNGSLLNSGGISFHQREITAAVLESVPGNNLGGAVDAISIGRDINALAHLAEIVESSDKGRIGAGAIHIARATGLNVDAEFCQRIGEFIMDYDSCILCITDGVGNPTVLAKVIYTFYQLSKNYIPLNIVANIIRKSVTGKIFSVSSRNLPSARFMENVLTPEEWKKRSIETDGPLLKQGCRELANSFITIED